MVTRIKQLVFQSYEHVRQFYIRMSERLKGLCIMYIHKIRTNQYVAVIKY
jgi:hypothetical protein